VGGGGAECGNPHWAERVEVLTRMGVLEPTRSELAGLEWATVEYLEGWEAWWAERFGSEGGGAGVGIVVRQIRLGEEAPYWNDVARRMRSGERERRRYAEGWGSGT